MTSIMKRSMNRCPRNAAARLAAAFLLLALAAGPAAAEPLQLSIGKAVEMGLQHDEQLRQAAAGIDGAAADLRRAKAGRLPSLSLAGQYTRNIKKPAFFLPPEFGEMFGEDGGGGGVSYVEIGEDNAFSAQALATYNLFTSGRVSAAIGAGREGLAAYREQERAAADYVRYRVREAYYTALLAAKIVDINERAFALTEEAVRVSRAGHDEGTVSRFDLLRAEVELANRRTPLVKAHNDLDQSLITLRRRIGIEADAEIALVDSLETVAMPGTLDGQLAGMRTASPELAALEHQVEAMRHNLDLQRAGRWPVLQLTGSFTVQSEWSNEFVPDTDYIARSAAVGVGFNIPIFDGLETKGRIGKARAELRAAELEFERVEREKALVVRGTWLALENALVSLEGREEGVRLAEEAYRLALVRLRNGLATPLERLDAELALTTARGQLAEALYACNVARAGLELATGSSE
ncbi:MAG: TolC family protein [Candidatus Krumholzibacteriota bacterium]|nr:TolC family protein [Candidatus Krumholzibacteriota bacterium]